MSGHGPARSRWRVTTKRDGQAWVHRNRRFDFFRLHLRIFAPSQKLDKTTWKAEGAPQRSSRATELPFKSSPSGSIRTTPSHSVPLEENLAFLDFCLSLQQGVLSALGPPAQFRLRSAAAILEASR